MHRSSHWLQQNYWSLNEPFMLLMAGVPSKAKQINFFVFNEAFHEFNYPILSQLFIVNIFVNSIFTHFYLKQYPLGNEWANLRK